MAGGRGCRDWLRVGDRVVEGHERAGIKGRKAPHGRRARGWLVAGNMMSDGSGGKNGRLAMGREGVRVLLVGRAHMDWGEVDGRGGREDPSGREGKVEGGRRKGAELMRRVGEGHPVGWRGVRGRPRGGRDEPLAVREEAGPSAVIGVWGEVRRIELVHEARVREHGRGVGRKMVTRRWRGVETVGRGRRVRSDGRVLARRTRLLERVVGSWMVWVRREVHRLVLLLEGVVLRGLLVPVRKPSFALPALSFDVRSLMDHRRALGDGLARSRPRVRPRPLSDRPLAG